jgi:hypothetical protein
MAVLRKLLALLCFAAFANPASAQLTPNSPDEIAAAAADCWSAVGPASVDEAKLKKLGWAAGSMRSSDGKATETPLRFFSKSGSSVLLMMMNSGKMSGCTILSRVARPEDIAATAKLLLSKLTAFDPSVKGVRQGQSIYYLAAPRVAELAPTGSMEKPSTRIVVGYTSAEKK